MTYPLLSIEDLSVVFTTERQVQQAVNHVSFNLNRGEILALVGESGSGKSVTSLSILQLLPQPPAKYTSGRILFSPDNTNRFNLLEANKKFLQKIRGNQVSMIFQEPMTSLNPVMKCGDQIMEVLLQHKNLNSEKARQLTTHWLDRVNLPLPDKIFHRYPHELSGGQKQRVMIAMAMCCEPALLICDEPTTALDVTVQKSILDLIRDLQKERQMSVLFITHDLGVVAEIADRVAIMYKGEIVETGTTQKIFQEAEHPYTRALIACRPSLHPRGEPLPVVADFLEVGENKIEKAVNLPKKSSEEVLVEVKNLSVKFTVSKNLLGRTKEYYKAVDGVSFEIYKGETLGLVGESGCGKTTLGRTLLRLIEPDSGQIIYNGEDINNRTRKENKDLRKLVQLVFQDPYSSLNPRLSIGHAIEEPMQIAGLDVKSRKKKLNALLDKVNLPSTVASRYPHEFSGGQRQRIVIARALSMDPQFLVCDESVSALDVSVQAQVLNLLNELKNDLGLTMLFISHDLSVVRYMCDRIMVMKAGKIIEKGAADDIYFHPQHPYTKSLLAAIPNSP